MYGTVVTAKPERGFFFIRPDGAKLNEENHFAHIKDWGDVLAVGTQVEFESSRTERGLQATPGVSQ